MNDLLTLTLTLRAAQFLADERPKYEKLTSVVDLKPETAQEKPLAPRVGKERRLL